MLLVIFINRHILKEIPMSNQQPSIDDLTALFTKTAQALRYEQDKNQYLQAQLDAAKQAGPAAQGPGLTVLIDGSGSMEAAYVKSEAPLKVALDAALALSKSGANVTMGLWGDESVHIIKNEDSAIAAKEGLHCGTDFAPAVDYMATTAAATDKPQHFVIISDGDLTDIVLVKTVELLRANPKTTLDFVIMQPGTDSYQTQMGALAQALSNEFPDQVILYTVPKEGDVTSSLQNIATVRTGYQKPQWGLTAPGFAGGPV
jgi:hypothetical protein